MTTHSCFRTVKVLTVIAAAILALLVCVLVAQKAEAKSSGETCKSYGLGGSFHVCISNTASPKPATKGEPLTFTIKVTNACTPEEGCSFNDNIKDFLRSSSLEFVSGTVTAPSGTGGCTEDSPGTVNCDGFFLNPGESATTTIEVTPTKSGRRFANTAVEEAFGTTSTEHYRVK